MNNTDIITILIILLVVVILYSVMQTYMSSQYLNEQSMLQNAEQQKKITVVTTNGAPTNSDDVAVDNINIQNTQPNSQFPMQQMPLIDPVANYDRLKLTDPFIDATARTSIDQIPLPYFGQYINYPSRGIIDKYHRVGLLIADKPILKYEKINAVNDIIDNNDIVIDDGVIIDKKCVGNRCNKIKYDKQYTNNNFIPKSSKALILPNTVLTVPSSNKKLNVPYSVKLEGFEGFEEFEGFNNVENDIQGNNILELMGMKLYQNTYKYFTSFTQGNKIIKVMVNTQNNKELYNGDHVYIPELKQRYTVQMDEVDGVLYNPFFF